MKKLIALIMALSVLAVACGDDDAAPATTAPAPTTTTQATTTTTQAPTTTAAPSAFAGVTTCEGLADATMVMLQDVIDFLGALTPEEFSDISNGAPNDMLDEIAVRGEGIGARAMELECADLDGQVQARAGELTSEPTNAIGQLIIQGTADGQDVMSRLFR